MDLLDAVLERYETVPIERDAEQRLLDEREAYLIRFREVRETVLRASLEEAAWRLDQRGHHAWVEEETTDGTHPDERDAITLSFVPIGYVAADEEASSITFVADTSVERVVVREHIRGTHDEEIVIGLFNPAELDHQEVAMLCAELVRRAFSVYPPLPSKEASDPSIARD